MAGTGGLCASSGDDAAIAQHLLLVRPTGASWTSWCFDSRVARLTAKTRTSAPGTCAVCPRMSPPRGACSGHGQVRMAGNLDWTKSMNDLLADGQRQSFGGPAGRERDRVLAALVPSVGLLVCCPT